MNDYLFFKSEEQAIRALSLLTGANVRIAKGGLFDRAKNWLKEKFTGFKKFDLNNESNAISYVRYNKKKKILEVNFNKRGRYQYFRVPEDVFLEMMESTSKGEYLNKEIRDSYQYRKVAKQEERRMRIGKKLSRSVFIGRLLIKQGHTTPYDPSKHHGM